MHHFACRFQKISRGDTPEPPSGRRASAAHFRPLALKLKFYQLATTNFLPYSYQLPTFTHFFISYQLWAPPLTAPRLVA